MDTGKFSPKQYRDCLYQLDRIGRFLGGDRATFTALSRLKNEPRSILDVGCGGGLFTLKLAERYPSAKIVGIDSEPQAIEFAKERLSQATPPANNVEFILKRAEELDTLETFDVVMATLVCHHLSDDELVHFIAEAYRRAKMAVILNDLHRHPLASLGFALTAPLLFPNRMVLHDGLVSIRRGFLAAEWPLFMQKALIPSAEFSLSWHFAFRWIAMIIKTDPR